MHVTATTTTDLTARFTGHQSREDIGGERPHIVSVVDNIALDEIEVLGEVFTASELPARLVAALVKSVDQMEFEG
jgi:hypothetical protein